MEQGTVLRIEKVSPNDGPGLRTVVFLKGCPLHCQWCSTPESQHAAPEWSYKPRKCLHCAACIRACPHGALSVAADRVTLLRDRKKCVSCFACAAVCPTHAISVYGKTMTVDEVMGEIRKDSLFYFHSGGGVTLSGGDILLQADFAQAILRACQDECIHTMAELDLYGGYENVHKIFEQLDACFIDLKVMDGEIHKAVTGVDNGSILANARRVSREFPGVPLDIRVPLIPGINDDAKNLCATAAFCRELPTCRSLELLPFHRLGSAAYEYLGRAYPMGDQPAMTFEAACDAAACLQGRELPFALKISGKAL